jgi:hypothetical protein
MKQTVCAVVILGLLALSTPAFAQAPAPTTRPRSVAMGIAGLFTLGAGIGMISVPGETYTVLGDEFCLTERAVSYGACSTNPDLRRFGYFALAAGGIMTLAGFSRVQVSPTYKGVKATTTFSW